jgi:hypothetical protein
MSSATRSGASKKSRKRLRLRQESVSFVVRIEDWSWSLSFGISAPSDTADEFEDFRHLEVHGNLIRPPGMMVERVELSFLPKISLNESIRRPSKQTTIGLLQLRAKRLNGIISMPADALGPVLNTLAAGRLRHVIINADKIRHQQALVRGFRFERKIAKHDLPIN